MRIAIIGTGYVGLVSGACFAELGLDVTCVDKDKRKVEMLERGDIPIFEPGLDRIVEKNVAAGRLRFTTSLPEAVKGIHAVFIAVGTPPDEENDGGADLRYVYGVADELADHIEEDTIIVTKSTVPVGTGDRVKAIIKRKRPDLKFHIASNPEFLREGCAVQDFLQPDRVLVGTESEEAREIMALLYKPLTAQGAALLQTDLRTAELTKYAANAFLATKIAFINEIADICEKVGANIEQLADGIGSDHRIGRNYLSPGPGFGGSCFPKDTLALRKIGRDFEAPTQVVDAVVKSNDNRKHAMAKKIIAANGGDVFCKNIALLGLAFKANTDDMRESPSLVIVPTLRKEGAHIRAFDPEAMEQAQKELGDEEITWCKDAYDALDGADCAVIATEWNEFRNLDLDEVKKRLKTPLLIDLRNLYPRHYVQKFGLKYVSIGRP